MRDDLKREIVFTPAFDKRSDDPHKNYGIHGVTMTWYVRGPKGAVQFVVYTSWHLPHVTAEMERKAAAGVSAYQGSLLWKPMAADLGYHSPVPMYEGQTILTGDCEILGGPCYYDGSSLNADRVFEVLLREGGDKVWEQLEDYYEETFERP